MAHYLIMKGHRLGGSDTLFVGFSSPQQYVALVPSTVKSPEYLGNINQKGSNS